MIEKNLNSEELAAIKEIQNSYSDLTNNLGLLHTRRLELQYALSNIESEIEKLNAEFNELMTKDNQLNEKLSSKYGVGSLIDIETGIVRVNT